MPPRKPTSTSKAADAKVSEDKTFNDNNTLVSTLLYHTL
jgi:hypothetical protein